MSALLGILAGVLGAAALLLLWRMGTLVKERDEARRAADEAKTAAEAVRRDSKSARDELENKRRELADLKGERDDLKKKLFDSKEESRRRLDNQSKRQEDDRDARYRELAGAVQSLRDEVGTERKRREEAEKQLAQERERVRQLEQAAERPAPAPRWKEERSAAPRPSETGEGAAREIDELKRKLAERERAMETLKRKTDNANRIYLMTKSQLELAQEKIATLGLRYAEVVAKLEGRPPPLGPSEPTPAQDARAEAEALADAMDDSEAPAPGTEEPPKIAGATT